MDYEQLLAQIRQTQAPRPKHPGPGATREAIEAYQDALDEYNFNAQAESLQRSTAADAEAKRAAEKGRELALSTRGSIIGSGFFAASVLLQKSPLLQFVRWLDAEADADAESDAFSVCVVRGPRGVFGLSLAEGSPTAPFVVVAGVHTTARFAEPSTHRLAAHPLHTPLRVAPPVPAPVAPPPPPGSDAASGGWPQGFFARQAPAPAVAGGAAAAGAPAGFPLAGRGSGPRLYFPGAAGGPPGAPAAMPWAGAAAASAAGGAAASSSFPRAPAAPGAAAAPFSLGTHGAPAAAPAPFARFPSAPAPTAAVAAAHGRVALPSESYRGFPGHPPGAYAGAPPQPAPPPPPRLEVGDHVVAIEALSLRELGVAAMSGGAAVSAAWLVALEACRRHAGGALLLRVRRRRRADGGEAAAAAAAAMATSALVASASAGAASPRHADVAAPEAAAAAAAGPALSAATAADAAAGGGGGGGGAGSSSRIASTVASAAATPPVAVRPQPVRPTWSYRAPAAALRHEVLRLLRAEKSALHYYRAPAEQWLANRLAPRLARALAAAERQPADAAVAAIVAAGIAAAATASAGTFVLPPVAAGGGGGGGGGDGGGDINVVALLAAEAAAFEAGMALRPSQPGGIVDLLLDGYLAPVPAAMDDDGSDIEIIEDAPAEASLVGGGHVDVD